MRAWFHFSDEDGLLYIEWLVPPDQPSEDIDHRKCKRRDFQLTHGQALREAGDDLHDKPQSLQQCDPLRETIALALVHDIRAPCTPDGGAILGAEAQLPKLGNGGDWMMSCSRYKAAHGEEEPVRECYAVVWGIQIHRKCDECKYCVPLAKLRATLSCLAAKKTMSSGAMTAMIIMASLRRAALRGLWCGAGTFGCTETHVEAKMVARQSHTMSKSLRQLLMSSHVSGKVEVLLFKTLVRRSVVSIASAKRSWNW